MAANPSRQRQRGQAHDSPRGWSGTAAGILALAALAGAGSAAYQYLSQPDRLPLRVIEIDGEFRKLDQAEIQRTVTGAIDGGFFTCDMQRLRTLVLAMPWVADVSIRRVWPDRLRMAVTEQVPLARWGDEALINADAGVFRPASLEGYAGLVRLQGPQGSERRVVDFYQAVVPAALARELRIRGVELDQRRHWWLRFNDGLTVSLGREDVDHRLAQFFRVYPNLIAQPGRRPVSVDLRYAHGFAVRWQETTLKDTPAGDRESKEKV